MPHPSSGWPSRQNCASGVADWRLELYGGIKHSFTNPAADQLTIPGFGYDLQADRRSWQSMLGLFGEVLGPARGHGSLRLKILDQRPATRYPARPGASAQTGLPVYSIICLNTSMIQAVAVGASHPVVAGLSARRSRARRCHRGDGLERARPADPARRAAGPPPVHRDRRSRRDRHGGTRSERTRQCRGHGHGGAPANGHGGTPANGHAGPVPAPHEVRGAAGPGLAPPVIIDGPDTVVTGEQARYRVRPSEGRTVVSWAAGGGSVAQSPDPAHPDELLLIADQPGDLAVTVRVREGLMQHRGTKSVTAVPDVTAAPPFTLRLFLNGWGLVVVAVLITGFAGALDALGDLTSADFIALVAPLTALLAVVTVMRGTEDPGSRPGNGTATHRF